MVRDLILALSLCHNVTPVYPDSQNRSRKEFQASSPDEVALVKFAESLGMKLEIREEDYIELQYPQGQREGWEIL